MAGDWIKMRIDLQTHPKIVRILSATQSDKFRVIGGLHAVWSVFDTHSVDGRLDGYSVTALEHIIGWPGFAQAMLNVGWLLDHDGEALSLPEFDEHNGTSGKRRGEDQKRKRNERKNPQFVRNLSAPGADALRTREEKRREESSNPVVVGHPAIDQLPGFEVPIIPPPSGKLDCPHREIIDLYHQILPMCPEVREWSTARATALRGRWNHDKERQTLDFWRGLFEYIANKCDFLIGRAGKTPFTVNLGWIVKHENFAKILEGHYENRQ